MQTAGTKGKHEHDVDVAGRICLGRNLWNRAAGRRGISAGNHQSANGLLVKHDDNCVLGRERDERVSTIC